MFDDALQSKAAMLLEQCRKNGLTLATAESCTGGLLAALLTEIPGSSDVFCGGVVSYSNELKQKLLYVPAESLDKYGAVSEQVAKHMAKGAQKIAGSDIAISITGIAGPGGGSSQKPVGLVYIGYATAHDTASEKHQFSGNRHDVRMQSVQGCLVLMEELVSRISASS